MLIEKVTRPTDELLRAMQQLIPQLGAHKVPPDPDELVALLASEGCTLLAARDPDASGRIVGLLCLNVYRVPTGVRSIIEDVVVDESVRGKGIGEALMRRALDLAREAGASGVALTSRPDREAANRLYQSMGFELRKTNAYIYKLN
jgi:ribosomal protein S18 acetylase RimI-like enzyme